MALLKQGADFSLKNRDEVLAIDLAPDRDVSFLRVYIDLHKDTCTNIALGPSIHIARS